MKTIINKTFNALLVLIAIFLLGITPSILISIFVSIFTKITFQECVTYPPFWIANIFGWLIASIYIEHELK